MKFLSLVFLVAVFGLSTGCNEDANVSELSTESSLIDNAPTPNNEVIVDEITEEETVETEPSPIDLVDESPNDEESADEILADDEESSDPEDNDLVDSEDEPDTPPAEEEEEVAEEEPPVEEEEEEEVAEEELENEIEDEVIVDEDSDEKCRKRGNLISNGSFEVVDDRRGLRNISLDSIISKKWDIFKSLPSKNTSKDSWYTSKGPGIEIQGDMTVAKAPHGKRMVELDSHGAEDTNSSMSQDVYLCRGKHVIKFMYYPRTKTEGDNTIEVKINDRVIKSVDMVKDGKWYRIRAPFRVKKKDTYKVTFSAKGKDNSLGGLVDKIRLHKKLRRAGVATVLLSLGDKDNINSPLIKKEIASAVIRKSVNFSSIKKKPKILMIKDANHNGESPDDFILTEAILKELYGSKKVKVHSGVVRPDDVKGFDVIYLLNPGYPMGSLVSANTIREAKESGAVGIIIAGDDMARGRNFNVSDLTGLEYKSNGTSACGIRIDNNRGGKYKVKLRKRFFKKLSTEERTLSYANDIDHTKILNKNMRVLAMAKVEGDKQCSSKFPTIVGYKLKHKKRAKNNLQKKDEVN